MQQQANHKVTLNELREIPKTPPIYKCCDNPQITYLPIVNINIDERTIGSVDVWRCACLYESIL